MKFKDQSDAGRQLAQKICSRLTGADVVVCALLPSGILVGYEVSQCLGTPLRPIVIRRVSHPFDPRYSIAAVAADGHYVKNFADEMFVDARWFAKRVKEETEKAKKIKSALDWPARADFLNKTVILVDDSIESGLSYSLAIVEITHLHPRRIVAAVPRVSFAQALKLEESVDELISLDIPLYGSCSVDECYEDLHTISDDEAVRLLHEADR